VQVVSSLLAAPLVLPVLQWLGLRRLVVWTGAGGLALGAAVRCASLDGWDQQVNTYVCSVSLKTVLQIQILKIYPYHYAFFPDLQGLEPQNNF
jgi:hypothetical protein